MKITSTFESIIIYYFNYPFLYKYILFENIFHIFPLFLNITFNRTIIIDQPILNRFFFTSLLYGGC